MSIELTDFLILFLGLFFFLFESFLLEKSSFIIWFNLLKVEIIEFFPFKILSNLLDRSILLVLWEELFLVKYLFLIDLFLSFSNLTSFEWFINLSNLFCNLFEDSFIFLFFISLFKFGSENIYLLYFFDIGWYIELFCFVI